MTEDISREALDAWVNDPMTQIFLNELRRRADACDQEALRLLQYEEFTRAAHARAAANLHRDIVALCSQLTTEGSEDDVSRDENYEDDALVDH